MCEEDQIIIGNATIDELPIDDCPNCSYHDDDSEQHPDPMRTAYDAAINMALTFYHWTHGITRICTRRRELASPHIRS